MMSKRDYIIMMNVQAFLVLRCDEYFTFCMPQHARCFSGLSLFGYVTVCMFQRWNELWKCELFPLTSDYVHGKWFEDEVWVNDIKQNVSNEFICLPLQYYNSIDRQIENWADTQSLRLFSLQVLFKMVSSLYGCATFIMYKCCISRKKRDTLLLILKVVC